MRAFCAPFAQDALFAPRGLLLLAGLLALPALAESEPGLGNPGTSAEISFRATALLHAADEPAAASWEGASAFDAMATIPWKRGSWTALLETGRGAGYGEHLPTLSGLYDDADDDPSIHVTEFYFDAPASEGRIGFEVGKLDLTARLESPACGRWDGAGFHSTGFVHSLAVAYPDPGPGGTLRVRPTGATTLSLGWASADASWERPFSRPFVWAQLEFARAHARRPGTWVVHAWRNGSDHERLDLPGTTTGAGWGAGVSGIQEVGGNAAFFLRAGLQREEIYAVGQSFSGGVMLSGTAFRRPHDEAGVAIGVARPGGPFATAAHAAGRVPADERHIEAYYRVNIGGGWSLSPHMHWITNPQGERSGDDARVFGVLTSWEG
ncbi:MAG: carbohydrate porin [Gemmatimonadota bacterium]|jgi:hypothetical protein|nr:carbohydrate porin [Gemmatimonadota bacterium]MDP6529788.1 carbohydrate porin [Gemmatimonadota bacterium]MDP6802980.1 carbohydrate porin [Gemmatimonadota bacterium]MDP7032616.1 carbohydrate porin [Gemmatimonadota bacterium]